MFGWQVAAAQRIYIIFSPKNYDSENHTAARTLVGTEGVYYSGGGGGTMVVVDFVGYSPLSEKMS